MLRDTIKTVLQPLLALALVAILNESVQRLRQQPPAPAPAPAAASSDSLDEAASDTPAPASHDNGKPSGGDIGDWRPDVDQVIDQLEDILISDLPQQQMNYTMANLNSVYDTKLYLVFIDYLATLQPNQVKAALKEQQEWLQRRKDESAAAFAESDGGSMAPYNAGEAYLQATRQRLEDLEQKLPH